MSLLQDALRRAQQGSGSGGGGTPHSDPGPFPPRRRDRRRLVPAAVLVLCLAAVAFLYLHRNEPADGKDRVAASEAPTEAPRVAPAASPVAPSPAASFPVPRTAVPRPEKGPAGGIRVVRSDRPASPGRTAPPPERVAPAAGSAAPAAGSAAPEVEGPSFLAVAAEPKTNPPAVATGPPHAPPDPRTLLLARYNQGILAQKQGEWDFSARIFREIVDADPSVTEAWNGLGFSLMRLGRLAEAGAAISRARSLSPNYPAAVVNEGLLRLQEGRTAESATLFERAASLDSSDPVPQVNLAIAQGILGRTRESENTLSAARRRFPANPEILYNLGALYERTGDRERSAEAYAAFLSASRGRFPAREAGVRDRLRAWGFLP